MPHKINVSFAQNLRYASTILFLPSAKMRVKSIKIGRLISKKKPAINKHHMVQSISNVFLINVIAKKGGRLIF